MKLIESTLSLEVTKGKEEINLTDDNPNVWYVLRKVVCYISKNETVSPHGMVVYSGNMMDHSYRRILFSGLVGRGKSTLSMVDPERFGSDPQGKGVLKRQNWGIYLSKHGKQTPFPCDCRIDIDLVKCVEVGRQNATETRNL